MKPDPRAIFIVICGFIGLKLGGFSGFILGLLAGWLVADTLKVNEMAQKVRPEVVRWGTAGLGIGALLGYLNRPSYLFGYQPSVNEIVQAGRISSDLVAPMATWGILGAIGGVIVAVALSKRVQT